MYTVAQDQAYDDIYIACIARDSVIGVELVLARRLVWSGSWHIRNIGRLLFYNFIVETKKRDIRDKKNRLLSQPDITF